MITRSATAASTDPMTPLVYKEVVSCARFSSIALTSSRLRLVAISILSFRLWKLKDHRKHSLINQLQYIITLTLWC